MNDHVNPLIAGIINESCGVKSYKVWFNYLGLRISQTVDCFDGEEVDKARAMLSAKHDVPMDRLIFIKAEEVINQ